jgi:hypothetical protein
LPCRFKLTSQLGRFVHCDKIRVIVSNGIPVLTILSGRAYVGLSNINCMGPHRQIFCHASILKLTSKLGRVCALR